MRRMRRAALLMFALIMIAALEMAQARNPYEPVQVESRTDWDTETIHIIRTYRLSPLDDPSNIPTRDFEDHGWVYHLSEMTHEEELGTDRRPLTRTVTKASDTDSRKKILRSLDDSMAVTTEDGYAGTLYLDFDSVTVEASGYATRNKSVTATRVYPDLSDADLSLIPKTIEDGGRTLTLDDVCWEEGWQTDAESGFLRYSATATYVGTTSSRYATGYTVTANYTGSVSRTDVEMVTYYADFIPIREAGLIVTPPPPQTDGSREIPDGDTVETEDGGSETASQTETEDSGSETDSQSETEQPSQERKEVDEKPDDPADGKSGSETGESGSGTTTAKTPTLREPQSGWEYARLKRTLYSCGLLLALGGAAYLIHKYKQRGGTSE